MKSITKAVTNIVAISLLFFGRLGPSAVLARDVPLHHKTSLSLNSATAPEALGRNASEDVPSDSLYYDYEGTDENNNDGNPNATPDVIYPNPDRLPRKPIPGEAREIKSSNLVLRGVSTNDPRGNEGDGGGAGTMNNNRVLIRPNEVVDYGLVESNKDMKGHDLIDSIMYIYYGAGSSGSALGSKEVGGNIIVIGAVVALAAQLLTIIILFLKHRRSRHKNLMFPVLAALLVMMFFANFLFIVGVQSTREALKCEIIAIVLHYLHLSTTVWVFLYIFCVHQFIKNSAGPNINFLLSLGVGTPAMYIVFNYMISASNYEVSNYCWMSVKKGMIFNYMLPISFFIVATAVYGTLCLRRLRNKQRQQFTESIESFIEHSRSEQMLNQIRQMGPDCPQKAPNGCPMNSAYGASTVITHKKLARCHSNPSATTLKRSQQMRSANLTTSSINLTSSSMSPTKEVPSMQERAPCCAGLLNHSQPNVMHQPVMIPPPTPHCLDLMGTSKSICGESKYSLGSISLANLSIQSLSSENEDFEDYKSAVKFAILFQIMFSICWFLAVIALEYPTSMMPIIFVIVLNIVNWILLAKCQAICPLMIASPLSTTTVAPEMHSNSFSKKSVKSNKSAGGGADHHHRNQYHHSHREVPNNVPAGVITAAAGGGGNGDKCGGGVLRSPGKEEKETTPPLPAALAIPFDDLVGGANQKKKKDSVSSIDTIPLLAKSAGLRADIMNASATIIDNLDGEPLEDVVADRSPTDKLTNGHVGYNLDSIAHRSEFISTIST